jgi:TfoX/Sxy family transcriptional regulator of competence genes
MLADAGGEMAGSSWQKSPPELVAAFGALAARRPELAIRRMFGYPCGFVGGHMTTGLFADRWFVRLPEDARAELLGEPGAVPFEPLAGRPMKEYVELPARLVADPAAVDAWVDRAIEFARTLPPKR